MSLKDEIEFVIQEEERRRRRTTQRIQRSSRMLVKPTYFAVFAAKVIVRWRGLFQKPEPGTVVKKPVKPDVTFMTLLKSDLRAIRKRLFPVKRPKKIPGADESWKDWEGQV